MNIGPISFLPRGLLDFLGLRSLGKYPRDLSDTIVGTIDLSTLLQQDQVERIELSETFTGPATRQSGAYTFGVNGVVPEREFWWVLSYNMTCLLSGATAESGPPVPAYTRPGAPVNPFWLFPGPQPFGYNYNGIDNLLLGNAAGQYYPIVGSAAPFFIPSGAQVVYVLGTTPCVLAAGQSFVTQLNMEVVRLSKA